MNECLFKEDPTQCPHYEKKVRGLIKKIGDCRWIVDKILNGPICQFRFHGMDADTVNKIKKVLDKQEGFTK